MSAKNDGNVNSPTESEQQKYPFGLSSPQFAVLLVLVGIIGPGFLVYSLEQANLSTAADFVWIAGYGTTIFVVWFIWLRPLDPVGSSAQDTSLTGESEQSDTAAEERDSESDSSDRTESSVEDSTLATEDRSEESTQESSDSPESK
jgi:hypothetical protein